MLKASAFSIDSDEITIPGIIIFGENYDEAIKVAEMTRDHFEQPGFKSTIDVVFEESDNGDFDLIILFSPSVGSVKIEGVDNEIINNIVDGLKCVEKYIIILGYDFDKLNIIESKTFSLFKNEINLNGKTIKGIAKNKVDWNNVL